MTVLSQEHSTMDNTMTVDALTRARWLLEQHRAGAPFTSFLAAEPAADMGHAYDVQDAFVALLSQAGRGSPAGYKIGLTGRPMQQMCGIDHPVAGVVLSQRVYRSPAAVRGDGFVRLGVESELAVQFARPLSARPGTAVSADDVLASLGAAAAAFELVDDRGADYGALEARSLVADNSWNEGIVLGAPVALGDLGDFGALDGTLEIDGRVVDHGRSGSALGGPLAAVAWLAEHLAARGRRIEAGDWVMTGSLVTTRFAQPGERYRFALGALPAVELEIG